MKRILSIILAAMLALAATTALADISYNGASPISEEPTTISVLTTNGASLNSNFEGMIWWQEVLAKANVTLELELIDPSSYGDVVKPRLAAAVDLPDLVQISGRDADMSYINSGLFLELGDLYEQYGFNFASQFEQHPQLRAEITTPAGEMYYLPYVYTTDSNMRCLMVNAGYLGALNMTMDDLKTMDDYYNYLVAVKEQDVNGNGDAEDEIPLFMRSGMIQLWAMYWGLDLTDSGGYQVEDDGTVICGYIDERYKEFLTWANQLYTEGLLYNEYATANLDMQTALYSANQVGSVIHFISNCTGYSRTINPDWQFNVDDPIMMPIVPLVGPHGDQPVYGRDALGGFYGINVHCEQPELVFAFCDYLQGEEAGVLTWYGIEGTDYEIVDGEYVFSEVYTTNADNYLRNMGYNFAGLPSYQLNYMTKECQAVRDMAKVLSDYVVNPSVTFAFRSEAENEVINAYAADLSTYFSENLSAFIMGTRSLDEWDAYVENVKAMGIDQLLAVYQAFADRASAA